MKFKSILFPLAVIVAIITFFIYTNRECNTLPHIYPNRERSNLYELAYPELASASSIDLRNIIIKANEGEPNDQFHLGVMYENGDGVPEDFNEAIKWYRSAAEQGEARAQFHLGLMCYYKNKDVDYKEAFKWFAKAADQGHMGAQFILGEMYTHGYGVPKDYNESIKWYRKAAEQGHSNAPFALGTLYYLTENYKEAVKWFTKAAEQGNAIAQFNLGGMYYKGVGVIEDYKEAVKWFTKAAEQDFADAQLKLGFMYYEGEGVIKDYVEAYKWALIAGMNGADVAEIKQLLATKMTPVQIAEAQKRAKDFVEEKEKTMSLK